MNKKKPDQATEGGEAPAPTGAGTLAAPTVDWDDSEMRSTYANVVNASSSREEVTVFFGSNLTWNPAQASKLHVKLTDRITLNPHAAKRLWILLGAILNQYEKRFGKIELDVAAAQIGADRQS